MRNVERMAKSFAVNLNTNRNTTVEVDEGVTNMFANFETSRMGKYFYLVVILYVVNTIIIILYRL